MGGGRSKSAKAVPEESRGETGERRTCDIGRTGLTSIRSAARPAGAVPGTAGSCPQPPGHFDESIQIGPSWRACLADFPQQQTLDRLQHCIPQCGPWLSASRRKPKLYGIRRTRSTNPEAAERHPGRSVARKEAHRRPFSRCRRCNPSEPNISLKRSLPQNRKWGVCVA